MTRPVYVPTPAEAAMGLQCTRPFAVQLAVLIAAPSPEEASRCAALIAENVQSSWVTHQTTARVVDVPPPTVAEIADAEVLHRFRPIRPEVMELLADGPIRGERVLDAIELGVRLGLEAAAQRAQGFTAAAIEAIAPDELLLTPKRLEVAHADPPEVVVHLGELGPLREEGEG